MNFDQWFNELEELAYNLQDPDIHLDPQKYKPYFQLGLTPYETINAEFHIEENFNF